MIRLLVIYNFAQKYRTAIFKAIDEKWDCQWWFGKNTTDIKGMDTSLLRNVNFIENRKLMGPVYEQRGIDNIVKRSDCDAILMLGEPFNLSTWKILLNNKFSSKPKRVYLWSHGWYGRESIIKRMVKRVFFGLADKIFLYGNYAKNIAISQGFKASKLEVIHNSLDHGEQIELRKKLLPSTIYKMHFGNDNPTLIFIGRLTAVKRLDLLFDAVELLEQKGEMYNVVLVGDGEQRDELETIVNEKNLGGRVWFYGACYDDTINAQLIYDADLCVAPGNVGLTAMHAMVFGTPVLTHNNFKKQMPEFEAIIPGKTGSYFIYGNIESLAKSISLWIKEHNDRETIRQACYNEIDEYWTPEYQMEILSSVIK